MYTQREYGEHQFQNIQEIKLDIEKTYRQLIFSSKKERNIEKDEEDNPIREVVMILVIVSLLKHVLDQKLRLHRL